MRTKKPVLTLLKCNESFGFSNVILNRQQISDKMGRALEKAEERVEKGRQKFLRSSHIIK